MGRFTVAAEFGLAIWGLVTLMTGRVGAIRGGRAKVLAVIALLPYPASFAMGFLVLTVLYLLKVQFNGQHLVEYMTIADMALFVAFLVLLVGLRTYWNRQAQREQA